MGHAIGCLASRSVFPTETSKTTYDIGLTATATPPTNCTFEELKNSIKVPLTDGSYKQRTVFTRTRTLESIRVLRKVLKPNKFRLFTSCLESQDFVEGQRREIAGELMDQEGRKKNWTVTTYQGVLITSSLIMVHLSKDCFTRTRDESPCQ